jgi:hypothetical protein
MRYDNEIENGQSSSDPNPIRCIALSIALIYYFRLPTKEDNSQRNDRQTPSREELAEILSQSIPEFDELIQIELETFVNTDNFVIPQGVAINQAVCRIRSIEFSFHFDFLFRFVNIFSPLLSVLLHEHLYVSSVFLVNQKHFPFKLFYKIFKVHNYHPNLSVNVYQQLIHSFVLVRNTVDQKILLISSTEQLNVNNNMNKIE